MKVYRLPQAGAVIEAGGARVLVDPLLVNEIDAATVLSLPIRVDKRKLEKERFDLVVISHRHHDHFSIESLNMLSRSAPVLIPRGAGFIKGTLGRMGFKSVHELSKFETLKVGSLEITATPSEIPIPEMGLLFAANGLVFWNPVDSIVTGDIARQALEFYGKIDMIFAAYQPLLESVIYLDSLGGGFPIETYGQLLRNLAMIRPTVVVPSAFSFHSRKPWVNQRQFPMTLGRFFDDVRRMVLGAQTHSLSPGDAIHFKAGQVTVEKQALGFLGVRPGKDLRSPDQLVQWRPDLGVPLLQEMKPSPPLDIRRAIQFLRKDFLTALNSKDFKADVDGFSEMEVYWNLDLVAGKTVVWQGAMDFRAAQPCQWRKPEEGRFSHLQTSITVEAIIGLLEGRFYGHALVNGDMIRIARRYYQIRDEKFLVRQILACPLYNVLLRGSDQRCVNRRLNQLGY